MYFRKAGWHVVAKAEILYPVPLFLVTIKLLYVSYFHPEECFLESELSPRLSIGTG